MCRNIKPLFHYDPPATQQEIHDASLQFVRKVSGFDKPSQANQKTFDKAVTKIATSIENMLSSLTTTAPFKSREVESAKTKQRYTKRFGKWEAE